MRDPVKVPLLAATMFVIEGTATPVPPIVIADLFTSSAAPLLNERAFAMTMAVELAHEDGREPPGFVRLSDDVFTVESPHVGPYHVHAVRLRSPEHGGEVACLAVIPTMAWPIYDHAGRTLVLRRLVRIDAPAWKALRDGRRARA